MRENDYSHVDKKPRLENKQEDMLQQQNLQHYIQFQDPNAELQALLLHQQKLRQQQQQILQFMSPSQRAHLQQLRQQLQGTQQIPPNVQAGVCARKLMMFLYHLQQRPADNSINYWRKLVAEYFSPRAKQRLCLSHYKKGMFPQAAPDMWLCGLCGTTSGKGVETTFDVLPRLNEIKFASGIIDELLSLDLPREYRTPNGLMILDYSKAVQVIVHEQFRVVREGQLRITFSQDLKILCWEFCARRHEELLLRRLIAPQVNQLLQVAHKCQSSESGSEGVSQQDLQMSSNMVLGAGRKLAKSMELQSLNDHGYPKKYVRALQISEVVKSMKDLMDFTYDHNIGPIDGLKRLSEQTARMRLQRQKMQEMEQLGNNGSVQAQMNGLTGNNSNNHHQVVGRGAMNGSAQAASALPHHHYMLKRLTPNSNQSPYLSQQRQNLATDGFTSSPQMQQQQSTMLGENHSHHSHGNDHDEEQMLDQMLQEMYENIQPVQREQAFSGHNGGKTNAKRKPRRQQQC